MNVLVIDSNKETADLLCEYLQINGHQCDSACDRSLIKKLIINEYDMVFLELDLPELDLIEIINELEKPYKRKNQKVYVLTTIDDISEKQIEKLKNKGIRSFLKKPIEMELLSEILEFDRKETGPALISSE